VIKKLHSLTSVFSLLVAATGVIDVLNNIKELCDEEEGVREASLLSVFTLLVAATRVV